MRRPDHGDRSQRGAGRLTFLCGLSAQAFICNGVITRVELDSDESAALLSGCEQRRAGAAEWIENYIAGEREPLGQRRENAERFLRRMQFVARTSPFDHVGNANDRRGICDWRERVQVEARG